MAAFGGRGMPYPRQGQKGQGHQGFPAPLDSPTFPLDATPSGRASKRGLRRLGSVRRAGFGKPYCPEFTLRSSPRITVRGHPVQGGRVPLRKAPLRSRVVPWSTKRHCGPLAFRRATEGSRVQRKMRGSQEGDKKPFVVLSPSCPPPWARRTPVGGHRHPRPPRAAKVHALRGRNLASSGAPLYRRR